MKNKINIYWFRRDLRLEDNIGLHHALKGPNPVLPLFIFDPHFKKNEFQLSFIKQAIIALKKDLQKNKSDILIYSVDPLKAISLILKDYNVETIYCNELDGPYEKEIDNKILNILNKKNINFEAFKDRYIFNEKEIKKSDGTPYTLFTPYKKKWIEFLTPKHIEPIKNKSLLKNLLKIKFKHTIDDQPFVPPKITKGIIENYHKTRDIPSIDGTSNLGHHLQIGTLSIRECVQIGQTLNKVWLSELIWREFFAQILRSFPHVMNSPFKQKYSKIKWINSKKDFSKWCEGKTGYPLVDAGMRQLNQTGFMHNRVRMVTASFLIKHLLIDYRWGEQYFATKLLDFDQASNNGNWQWVAGTGCDSTPYFRIFNPEIQLKKFDKNLEYVKKWIPEYGTENYPKKMIDHKFAYDRALVTYRKSLHS